jgi:gliding motility-associated-like protein
MTRITTTLSLLLLPFLVFAQPVNDDCSGLIDLGVAPACPDTVFFTNVDATASDIGFGNVPTCFEGLAQNDVWFAFTTSDTIFDYTITVTGLSDGSGSTPMSNPEVALYRGDCGFDLLAELACASAEDGSNFIELDVLGLTPNIVYFIRINDYSASATPNWGTFQLCVDEMEPASTIDEGGSTACSGILYDSGGEDGDYQNNENNTFTICPDQPHGCINFTLDNYFIESGSLDGLFFYDGDTPSPANLIAQIGGFSFSGDDGGGGVCYQVQAFSGCLTVNFTSDATSTFQGFEGSWECSTDCEPLEQVSVDANITEEQIVDFVSVAQTLATVTDINCDQGQYGLFEAGDQTNLGLERGLVMTTGSIANVPGPNTLPSAGQIGSGLGDPDLDYLSTQNGNGTLSQDACIIELDVLAATNELTFEYVFGSEEYPEFVDSDFNDIFAFLISGPGIVGDPNINNQENIAVLPNGMNTPVQINSLNNIQNWEYYRNNLGGTSLEYDGLTSDFLGVKKSLTARAQVQPCSTYHLKFAIADRGDQSYDSGVFISELRGGTPNLSVQYNSGIEYLVEDCVNTPDEVTIELSNALDDTSSYVVVIGGTATPDVDYILQMPDTIVFLPGETSLSFPIEALSDLITEPTETITISLTNDFGCGEVTYTEIFIELRDEIQVNIQIEQDTALICQDSSLVLEATGGASYFWTPVSVFSNPTSPTPTATPTMSQWVYVEGIVGPCVDNDSIYLQLVDPQIMAMPEDTVSICQGESVQFESTNNVNNMNLQWVPAAGLDDAGIPNPLATPDVTTEYIVSVDVAGCFVYDTVYIDVSPFDFPEVIGDTLLCEGYSVQLASTIATDTTTTTFVWTPDFALDNDSIAGPIATPLTTTTYELIATSENGACADTAQVTVEVFPANVTISNPDTTEICLGDSVVLSAVTSIGTADGLLWSPDDGTLSDTVGLEVTAVPEISGWYYSALTVGQCIVFDSAYIRVDSLPELEIMADPAEQPYCQGDIITLSSPAFEPGFYPDIEHEWISGFLYETPDTLFNMVFNAQDTVVFRRVTTNRACVDTAELLVNVIEPPVTNITPADTVICLGESVQFLLEITGQYDEVTWSGDGLSCTDCLDPVATPTSAGTATYNIEIDAEGCETPVSTSFQVLGDPIVSLNTMRSICEGGSIQLNTAADGISTYTWTSSTDPGFLSNDPLLTVSPVQTTTYFLVADNGVCPPVETEITIEVIPQASINLMPDALTICEGESVTIMTEVINPSDVDSFLWVNSVTNDTLFTQDITVPLDQTTTFMLFFSSADGCEDLMEEVTIEVLPLPVTDLISNTTICFGESIQLNLDSDDNSTYTWTSTDPAFNQFNVAEPVVSPAQTATYTLVADNGICPLDPQEVTVEVIGVVTLSLQGPNGLVCSGDEVQLTANAIGGSSEDQFNWTGSDGTTYQGDTILVAPEATTQYTLDYTSGGGCQMLTDSLLVQVEEGVTINGLIFEPDTVTYFIGNTVTITADYETNLTEGLIFSWFQNGELIQSGEGLEQITVDLLQADTVPFSLIIETPSGCTALFTSSILVERPIVDVPNVFTPNDDGDNDFFNIVVQGNSFGAIEIVEFQVYNRWGQQVYDNETPDTGWDGRMNNNEQPTEAYFYQISVAYLNGETLNFQGSVTLVR